MALGIVIFYFATNKDIQLPGLVANPPDLLFNRPGVAGANTAISHQPQATSGRESKTHLKLMVHVVN